ncbi:MAG: NUDIX domain-containing protein [bacterium]|nr:NUDIX domain-containing protein [bacterium]
MKHTESAGGIVINEKGEVLVVSQKRPDLNQSWSLPKGHIETGEDGLTAAKREINEESGVSSLELIRDLGSYKRHRINADGEDDISELKTIYMFLFKTIEKDLKPVDPDNPEARWVSKNEVANLLTHYKDKEFFLKNINEF